MTDETCTQTSKLQLITRLRSIHDFEHDETEAVCEEAATEIERLTTALQVETICHQVASDSNRAKREDIERLRAALERIAANDHTTSPSPVGPGHGAGVNFGLEWNAKIAREALRGAHETTSGT